MLDEARWVLVGRLVRKRTENLFLSGKVGCRARCVKTLWAGLPV